MPLITLIDLELPARPVLEITGPDKIYEGDQLFLTCSMNGSLPSANLYLMQGTNFLSKGFLEVNHGLLVLDDGPADFGCELHVKSVKMF